VGLEELVNMTPRPVFAAILTTAIGQFALLRYKSKDIVAERKSSGREYSSAQI
jgi:hypothetical protein